MYSDPKECLYCTNNETLKSLMIEIASLKVSRVFIFKEQTYRGRCLVAYNGHVNDLYELNDQERNDVMSDVATVTQRGWTGILQTVNWYTWCICTYNTTHTCYSSNLCNIIQTLSVLATFCLILDL